MNDREDPTLWVRGEAIERVTNFKSLDPIKSGIGDYDKDIAAQIGMAKKRMLELTNIWKDTAAPNKTPPRWKLLNISSFKTTAPAKSTNC